MAKRAGPSISVKMILTSTLLILLIVGGFGVLNWIKTGELYDQAAEKQIEEFKRGLAAQGASSVQLFSNVVMLPLLNNQDRREIPSLVVKAVKQDPDLKVVYVLTRNKNVVDYCRVDRSQGDDLCDDSKYAFPDPDEAVELPDVKDESWDKLYTQWEKQAKGDETGAASAMVSYDDTENRLRYFAYPVYNGDLLTAKTAVEGSDDLHGFVVLGYSLQPIFDYEAESAEQKESATKKLALNTGAFGALFVLIGAVLAIFQGLQISKPIKLLAWKADQIARGDLEARVEVRSTDEIGLLGENFNFMADQIVVLLHQTAEKAHLEKELEVARTIQDTLVPPNDPVDKGFFNFAGYFQPATQCGGDWWTYHDLLGDKVLVVIGDVTGHGVPSAMITATAKAACDVARTIHHDDVSVTTLLEIMNDAIFQSAKRKFVMTCFASIMDPKNRTITYANAGHNFPYLYRNTGKRGEFGSLMIRGNRLGDLKESKYEAKTTELLPGDLIVWYTDGIVECENEAGEEYGEKRFRASIRRGAALAPGELRDNVVNEAMNFYGEMPRKDDITMVIGRIT
jgi:serine phosphatase RsbU (regulator of sigma subunit)